MTNSSIFSSRPNFLETYEVTSDEHLAHECFCERCEYYHYWRRILRYNFVAGVISPNLWLFNVAIICFILSKTSSCNSHSLTSLLGYSLCGLALYTMLAAGTFLSWSSIRV